MNLRLIELFAGIGSQAKALTNLGIEFEHWFVCEFDKYAIASYNAIHNTNFNTSDVTKITATDLNIVETDKYTYLLTYSFPCQDLSLAGKQAGMEKNSGTRSGLLWEVERLLNECDELPQILLMENVPQVHGTKNKEHFDKWIEYLESKGYKNYWQDLNAKNYGIPQNRNRCFMVSVLDNKPFEFPEPFELKLRLKDMLEDDVEEKYYLSDKQLVYILDGNNVALSSGRNINDRVVNPTIAKTISCRGASDQRADITNFVIDGIDDEITVKECKSILIPEKTKKGYAEAEEGDGVYINRPHQKRGCVQKDMIQTIKTQPNDVGVVVVGNYSPSGHSAARVVDPNGLAPTVMENHGTVTGVLLKKQLCNKLIQDGLVQEGDIIKHSYTTQILNGNKKCVEKSNEMITLTTRGDCIGVVVQDKSLWTDTQKQMITEDGNVKRYLDSDIVDEFKEGQVADISFPNGYNKANRVHDECPTINQTTTKSSFITKITQKPLRIRKLTPKECYRLMGFSDIDFDKASQVVSNAQLYKQAGNSIVVNVLEQIFKELFLKDVSSWLDKLLEVS